RSSARSRPEARWSCYGPVTRYAHACSLPQQPLIDLIPSRPRMAWPCPCRPPRSRNTAGPGRPSMIKRALSAALLIASLVPASFVPAWAQTSWPNQREGDFILRDFKFASGETIAELKQHYTTLGTEKRNEAGEL